MNNCVLEEGNIYIRKNDLDSLKKLYQTNRPIKCLDWPYLFSKMFTNACLYNRYDIAYWLFNVYQDFDVTTQIALRPTFNHTRWLTRKKNFHKLHNWLNEVTLKKIE